MKKINLMFGFFFLAFLMVCAVPTFCGTFSWMKKYYFDQYDEVMRKFNTRYYEPVAKVDEKLYAKQKEVLTWKFPFRVKDYSSGYIANKIFQNLMDLPEKKQFETQLVQVFPFRIIFSEISMAFRKFAGMKRPIEFSKYYLRPDGTLGLLSDDKGGEFTLLKAILDIKAATEEIDARFHMLVRPDNVWDENQDIYFGLRDKSNQILNTRIKQLEQAGVSIWDMRTQWNQLPDRKKLFFKTDHHWNVYGALKGSEIVAAMLRDKYQLDYDVKAFDPDLFQKLKLKNLFLGSLGRMLTLEYAQKSEPEDFDILFPSWNTDFTMTSSNRFCERGDFSIFLFAECWKYEPYKIDLYETDPYTSWLSGNLAWVRIVNHKIPAGKGKKLLFIKDSFGSSMLPYLALQTREIMMIDPRSRNVEKIKEIIRKEKPDYVFWMYSLIM